MNILMLNWRDVAHPQSGGAELVTLEHARAWVKAGHAVTWFTAGFNRAAPESHINGVRILRRGRWWSVYLHAAFYLLFYSKKFDVIVDQAHGIPFFSPLFTRKPVVVFIHEIAGDIWNVMFPFPVSALGRLLEKWYFRLYRHCFFWTIAPSTVEELVHRGIPRGQCVAIPNPLVVGTKGLIRDRPKEKVPTYIFVSRVVRMKGIEEVIKAFSFILRTQPKAKLWIIGGGEKRYMDELVEMMKEYGISQNVNVWGRVPEGKKFELMSRAHLLLHASVKEGWGLVVLEAAAVGTPSVVYNVSGLKDVVKNNITGVVLADNSPDRMAAAAMKLTYDSARYRDFQKNGKEWVNSLKWTTVTGESLRLLKKAMQ